MNNLLADTKLAIELEEKGYEFYKNTATKTTNPLASSTLSSLADREKLHIEKIQELYLSLSNKKEPTTIWLSATEITSDKKTLLKPILEKLRTRLDKKFDTEADINETYLIAEGLERDSYALYTKIAKETTNDIAKKFFSALAQEENEHYAILDDTLLYLKHPGDWFKKEERWIVEG